MVALLAAFVFSASSGLRPLLQEHQQQIQEASQDDERPVAYLDYACSALAPVAQFVVAHQSVVKVPLPPVLKLEEKPVSLPPARVDQYFLTLFRLIISPNAP